MQRKRMPVPRVFGKFRLDPLDYTSRFAPGRRHDTAAA